MISSSKSRATFESFYLPTRSVNFFPSKPLLRNKSIALLTPLPTKISVNSSKSFSSLAVTSFFYISSLITSSSTAISSFDFFYRIFYDGSGTLATEIIPLLALLRLNYEELALVISFWIISFIFFLSCTVSIDDFTKSCWYVSVVWAPSLFTLDLLIITSVWVDSSNIFFTGAGCLNDAFCSSSRLRSASSAYALEFVLVSRRLVCLFLEAWSLDRAIMSSSSSSSACAAIRFFLSIWLVFCFPFSNAF